MKRASHIALAWVIGLIGVFGLEGTNGASSPMVVAAVLVYWLPKIAASLSEIASSSRSEK